MLFLKLEQTSRSQNANGIFPGASGTAGKVAKGDVGLVPDFFLHCPMEVIGYSSSSS